jgi:glyoxylase-like metal-dependent hydrolase (beta-lactamase superfamily II)
MLSWTVGNATITSVVESETPTSPRFLYRDMSKVEVLERAAKAPWLRPNFVSDEGYLLQKIQCLVVELGELRIAVDTCVGNDKQRSNELWTNLDGPFLEDLAKAGYPPESITHVVCTHLHVDHVGWNTKLVDGQWVPTFPNARYLFVDAEYRHWRDEPSLFDGEDPFGDSVAPVLDAGLVDMVEPDHRISGQAGDAETVWFQSTPGHTPGHISLVIESAGQRAVITGDMLHHPMQLADPTLSSMFDTDSVASRQTREEVFPGWADGHTLVIGTHFGTPTAGRLVADGDGYRLDWS